MSGPMLSCPRCGEAATGKFCSSCGAPLAGATCRDCGAPLTPGARFCHRCGAAAGAGMQGNRGLSGALPWAIAGVALVCLVALVAGQRFAHRGADAAPDSLATTQAGAAPDISNMSPGERADRLFNLVMSMHERGQSDSVQAFAPMAIAAYQMIGPLNADQHYDVGRIAAISGDAELASAEADTILKANPRHLLGLILAANAARVRHDTKGEADYERRLRAAAPAERAKQLPEYAAHANDITFALEQKGP
jgi:hypothetical protein